MKMKKFNNKKVLLLSSRYGISNSANAVCVKNIATELKQRGYEVFVLTSSGCEEDQENLQDGVKVTALKRSFYSKILDDSRSNELNVKNITFKIISLFRMVFNVFFYPNVSPIRSIRIYNKAKELIEKNDIDLVISTYRPYENTYTAIKLSKNKHRHLLVYDFQLDVLCEPNQKYNFVKRMLKLKANRILTIELDNLNGVILPESAEFDYHERNGIMFAGFPVYVPSSITKSSFEYDSQFINISYIGSLSIDNRNPEKSFLLISNINKLAGKKFLIHIWGNIDENIQAMVDETDCVIYHGLVENEYTTDLLRKSDLLLNISNEKTYNMLPSKIFQEFAAERPILNFVKNRADISLPFFEKYGYTFNIFEDEIETAKIEIVYEAIIKLLKQEISITYDLLEKYTPNYFVDIIERSINGDNQR